MGLGLTTNPFTAARQSDLRGGVDIPLPRGAPDRPQGAYILVWPNPNPDPDPKLNPNPTYGTCAHASTDTPV